MTVSSFTAREIERRLPASGKPLLVVRYNELESQWAGATAKNVAAVFASATEQDAVLFFDEADAIAGRRFTSVDQGYQREANAVCGGRWR